MKPEADRARNARRGRGKSRRRSEAGDEIFLRSEEHTSELQSRLHLVCRLLLEKKKKKEPLQSQPAILPPPAPFLAFNPWRLRRFVRLMAPTTSSDTAPSTCVLLPTRH